MALKVEIAGIVFSVSSDRRVEPAGLNNACRNFLCCSKEQEVTLHYRYGRLPRVPLREEDILFGTSRTGLWSLYRSEGQNIFALRSPADGSAAPYCIALFSPDFRKGEIFRLLRDDEGTSDALQADLMSYPLSEVLMVCLLAQGRGLMAHACGIDDHGRGYLFAGNSTHGKSTMARLWKENAVVLNDDRIVIRRREGRFWMYGTPWHGDYSGVSPSGVPIEKIFFLRHAGANEAGHREGISAASMLLTRCFAALWDAEGMRFTLDFCAQMVETVPCFELGFAADRNILDFVRGVG